jgi:penicillin-binding protein-related factor A (putative recombinase)
VVWVRQSGSIQELQTMPAFGAASKFELKCLDPQQAEHLKQTLQRSEAIRDFLHVPARQGALCYFFDQTETRCWSVDKNHAFIDAGGWQT